MSVRIVHVIDGLGSGGAERLLTSYVKELHRTGNDVHVVVLDERNENPEQRNIEDAGIPTTLVPVGKLRNIFQIRRLYLKLKELRPDVVHAHLQFSSILGSLICRVLSIPMLATVHTLEGPEMSNRDGLRRWLMYKLIERFADRVICLSDAAASFARGNGLANARIEVLPNGIDLNEFTQLSDSERSALRTSLGIPETVPLILSVAVLRPPKGLDRLVRAMPGILATVKDARLLIVGDGPEKERLGNLAAELGVDANVVLAGRRTDVPHLMAAADLFVLPTLDDAQPTVIMEAFAAQLPVVASKVGGIPDMIDDRVDGILVPPDDVAAIEVVVTDLLGASVRREALAQAGRNTVEEKFSLQRQVARLTQLYETLLSDSKSH